MKPRVTIYGIFRNGKLIEKVTERTDLNYGCKDLAINRLLTYTKIVENEDDDAEYSMCVMFEMFQKEVINNEKSSIYR